MLRLIMVPLDGSRFAESALPLALALSRKTGAALHLVTVQEPIPSFAYDEWENAAQHWSTEYLNSAVERASRHAGGGVSSTLLAGDVAEVLEEEAQARSAELVVMATHGRGVLSRAWLGSVADAFLHHTRRPLLLVRPDGEGTEPELAAEISFSKVLVPLDGTELSESVLTHAASFADLFGAKLRLMRVVPYPMQFSSPYLPHTIQMNQQFVAEAQQAGLAYLMEKAEALGGEGRQVEVAVVVVAQPGQGILAELEDSGCDLLAMATHGRGGLTRAILGSTADKVVRGTHVPVLLYRPPD